jgi:ABC-type amino acid transport substrate-binding protein
MRLGMNIIAFERVQDALLALSNRKIDAYIDTVPAIDYARQFVMADDLRVSAPTPFSVSLAFGVRKDFPNWSRY